MRLTDTIKHLIIINVILFVAPQLFRIDISNVLALYFPQNESFGFWQYVTHMFMHGSFGHILFNMYGLWAFGTPLEQMWGRNKFIFFYFSAGIGAGLIYTLVNYYQFNQLYEVFVQLGLNSDEILQILETGRSSDSRVVNNITQDQFNEIVLLFNTPAVGASGAIYGILVAFGIHFKDAKLALIFFPVPIAAKYFIPAIILIDVFFGVTKYSIRNIAHFAHIGGAIIGFIVAFYWKRNQTKRWN
jgi:membrane associated rhomboid family serine protease